MKLISYILGLLFAVMMYGNLPAQADTNNISINWECLNLTEKQEQKFALFDQDWEKIQTIIRPKLTRDQERLKLMLTNPNISDTQIKELQKQIFIRQEQLRYYALNNFLSKRRLLTPNQRIMLHEMFLIQYQLKKTN
ncbi:MAG: hypothetical protein ACD_20C00156G0001 [uncultured bacterium]|nr:MAG: hypothetical protein ACD_20C00156G0001 [uncultured bacterium]HBH18586.1 hypothetical protein [Cyanobacteria bacterium UBA9579]